MAINLMVILDLLQMHGKIVNNILPNGGLMVTYISKK